NQAGSIAIIGTGSVSGAGVSLIANNAVFGTTSSLSLGGPINGNAGTVTLTAASGDVTQSAGVVTGGNVLITAGGLIGPINTMSTGTLSLTTSGAGSAGNITVSESNALDSSRLAVSTDPGSAQTVTLTSTNAGGITLGGNVDLSTKGNDNLTLSAPNGNING